MKRILLFVFIFSSPFIYAQKLKITLFNRTGYDLDSVFFDENYPVGHIAKSSTKEIVMCKGFFVQDSLPYGRVVRGHIKGRQLKQDDGVILPDSPSHEVFAGNYKFDIVINENPDGTYNLRWARHR
jgi:hypothetical protein